MKAIYWHEGQFVQPQHFQLQDRYQRDYAYRFFTLGGPPPWGVKQMALAEGALRNRVVEVESCELLFPDGSWVVYPGNAQVAPRRLPAAAGDSDEVLDLYLALRRQPREGAAAQVDMEDSAEGESPVNRFRVVSTPQVDSYGDSGNADVQELQLQLQIVLASELAAYAHCDVLQFARLRQQQGQLVAEADYLPPALGLQGVPGGERLLRNIIDMLSARSGDFAAAVANRRYLPTVDYDMLSGLATLLAVQRALAACGHLGDGRRGSPWELYGLLRQLVSELGALAGLQPTADDEPGKWRADYRHDALSESFRGILQHLQRLLGRLAAPAQLIVDLPFDGTYYSAPVAAEALRTGGKKYLRVHLAAEGSNLVGLLASTAKVGSREFLPMLIARSLPGVVLRQAPAPSLPTVWREGQCFFSLEPAGAAWDSILRDGNLAVYSERSEDYAAMDLLVIPD